MALQQSLLVEPVSREREAFDDGRLYLLVKEHPRYDSRAWGGHVRAGAFLNHSEPFATLHVMSRPTGGEIRGYVRLGGLLYLRLPNYVGEWDALDIEVSRQVGCPVVTRDAESVPEAPRGAAPACGCDGVTPSGPDAGETRGAP